MLRKIILGKIDSIDSFIETIGREELLIERVQAKPHYHCEGISFNLDGSLREINRKKAEVYMPSKTIYSKFGIRILEKQQAIQGKYKPLTDDVAFFSIREAYALAKQFHNTLMHLKVHPDNKPLKQEMDTLLRRVVDYDYSKYRKYSLL